MLEILIFAGYLGLFLFVFWMIVAFLESRLQIAKRKRVLPSEEDTEDEPLVPVIMAAIKAYESSRAPERKRKQRELYQPKQETVSLWKIRGRVS